MMIVAALLAASLLSEGCATKSMNTVQNAQTEGIPLMVADQRILTDRRRLPQSAGATVQPDPPREIVHVSRGMVRQGRHADRLAAGSPHSHPDRRRPKEEHSHPGHFTQGRGFPLHVHGVPEEITFYETGFKNEL